MYVRLLLGLLCVLGCSQLADASPFAYVANYNGGTVSVVDLQNPSNSTPLSLPDATNLYGVAVNKFGSRVYVSDKGAAQVFAIDTADNSVTTIPVPFKASGLAVNPAGTRLFVAHPFDDSVSVFDVSTLPASFVKRVVIHGNPQAQLTAPDGPEGVAVSPEGDKVYVANGTSGTVSVFDATQGADGEEIMTQLTSVSVGAGPQGIALNPAGTRLYVATQQAIAIVDTTNFNAAVTKLLTNGPIAHGVAVKPDGSEFYVTMDGSSSSGILAVYNATEPYAQTATIAVGAGPMGVGAAIAIEAGVEKAKVVTANNLHPSTASVVDAASRGVTHTPAVGDAPVSLGSLVGPRLTSMTFTPAANGEVKPADPITVLNNNVALMPYGLDLQLNVKPDQNYKADWVRVDGVDLAAPYIVRTGTSPRTVTASFSRSGRTIYVTKNLGYGASGRVYSEASPAIDCGTTCDQSYPLATGVVLKVQADPGSKFQGWYGDGCVGSGDINSGPTNNYACTINTTTDPGTIDGNYHVVASFVVPPVSSFQGAYDGTASGGSIPCVATYTAEPSNSFNADKGTDITIVPATPTTTLSLPAPPITTGKFTITSGKITFSGGGTFIIN